MPGIIKIGNEILSSDEIVLEFNVEYLDVVSSKQLSIIDATNGAAPKLKEMKQAFGDKVPRLILRAWIDSMDDFYGKGQLTESQQKELAALIYSEYPYLRLSEIAVFIREFKLGKFRQFYGQIDPQAILVSLREFNRLRNEAIARYEREKAAAKREAEEADKKNRMSLSQFLKSHGVKSMDEYRLKFPTPNYISNER